MSYGVYSERFFNTSHVLQATCLEKDTFRVIPSIVLCKQRDQKYREKTKLVCSNLNAGCYFGLYYATHFQDVQHCTRRKRTVVPIIF
jgi:hypothetical protein